MKGRNFVAGLLVAGAVLLGGYFLFAHLLTPPAAGDGRVPVREDSAYRADAEIAQALVRLQNSREAAILISSGSSAQRRIALTFDGLTDRTGLQDVLAVLNSHQAKATFFVTGMQAAEEPQAVAAIRQAGQSVESNTLYGRPGMEKLTAAELVADFIRAQAIFRESTGQRPNLLKCNGTEYTDGVLQVAKAAGFKGVVQPTAVLNLRQITSTQAAGRFVDTLGSGSIVSISLSGGSASIGREPGKTESRAAVDKQPGLTMAETSRGAEAAAALDSVLAALSSAGYTTVYVEDFAGQGRGSGRQANPPVTAGVAAVDRGRVSTAEMMADPAAEISTVSTTEPAIAYTFGGLSNEAAVTDVLNRLQKLGIAATFFVLETELQHYPETVREIIAAGHEIGLAIRPQEDETAAQTGENIQRGRQLLQEQFGVNTTLIKQPWGNVTAAARKAVTALGCTLIGQSVNIVQGRHQHYGTAEQVMAEIFGPAVVSLARGQIVHFRMDYYTNDRLTGDLLEMIKQRKVDNIAYATEYDNPAVNPANDSRYSIRPVGAMLARTQFLYRYPADTGSIPTHLRSDRPGVAFDKRSLLPEAAKRYIGHENVNDRDRMLGFSKMETRRLDKSGRVHTTDNVIFLTFDDWGSDAAINKILYVLRKHRVPGTFFITTNNVLHNPNLLRGIALEGHEIAGHSELHQPMTVRDPASGRQFPTQSKEEYLGDLRTSYQKLLDITGDVQINGRPALTRFFRPPTLAISKMGFEALFATGYEYIISGSVNTADYQAENVSQLVRTMKNGIYTSQGGLNKGAVLIMHMGDGSAHTPIALDILLTANAARAEGDPAKFTVGRLADYIPAGYAQNNRKQSLRLNSR